MSQGNTNSALKLLINNMPNKIPTLSKVLLKQKHLKLLKSSSETLLLGEVAVAYGGINKSFVMEAKFLAKGSLGASGANGLGWQRILPSWKN